MSSMGAPRKSKTPDSTSFNTKSPKTAQNAQPSEDLRACDMKECMTESRAHKKSQATEHPGHTKVVIKFNCGFSNNLYIRGEGVKGLSWEKGALMKCTKPDEWTWETDSPFSKTAQIKVLINDKQYEIGENHTIDCGKSFTYSPRF